MLECNRRQKEVRKGETVFKCIHRESEVKGKQVTEGMCSLCPVRSFKHTKPCKENSLVKNSEVFDHDTTELEKEMPDSEVPQYPKLSLQMWLYKEALLRWQKAGRPKRSDKEVESLLNTYCKKCDWYDPEKERCKGCGCAVTSGAVAIFNKLRMATEKCPRELW